VFSFFFIRALVQITTLSRITMTRSTSTRKTNASARKTNTTQHAAKKKMSEVHPVRTLRSSTIIPEKKSETKKENSSTQSTRKKVSRIWYRNTYVQCRYISTCMLILLGFLFLIHIIWKLSIFLMVS